MGIQSWMTAATLIGLIIGLLLWIVALVITGGK